MIHLQEVKATLPPEVELVAVSKFHPAPLLQEAYGQGQRIFGESRVQELQAKQVQELVRKRSQDAYRSAPVHFIGHLQPNKVKYIAPYISLIHAVDSEKLLLEIEKQAAKANRVIPCLLELHIAQEATKYGFTPEACTALLEAGTWRQLPHVQIAGLMCMASNVDDAAQVEEEFHRALVYFNEVKARFFADDPAFCQRSWGMSHDYPLALRQGATLVRIGTAIFGARDYAKIHQR